MGYRRRTSFLAGLRVAQISEFSLIVAALGMSIGHITEGTMGLITLVGVFTIFLSTYMILYSSQLYRVLSFSHWSYKGKLIWFLNLLGLSLPLSRLVV